MFSMGIIESSEIMEKLNAESFSEAHKFKDHETFEDFDLGKEY